MKTSIYPLEFHPALTSEDFADFRFGLRHSWRDQAFAAIVGDWCEERGVRLEDVLLLYAAEEAPELQFLVAEMAERTLGQQKAMEVRSRELGHNYEPVRDHAGRFIRDESGAMMLRQPAHDTLPQLKRRVLSLFPQYPGRPSVPG